MTTRLRMVALGLGLAGAALAAFALPQAHEHHGAPPPPRSVSIPEGGLTLPMKDVGGRPVVDVTLDGRGPYPFILDTGAHVSVVDSALQRELALPLAPGVHAAPTAGGRSPDILLLPEIRLGAAEAQGVIAAVLPLGSLFPGAGPPRGVLSAAIFPGYLVTFDYPARRITIRSGELPPPDSAEVFGYGADEALPSIPVRIAGRATRVHLDTGSGYGLTLPQRWLKELPLAGTPTPGGRMRTPTGEASVVSARVEGEIAIGRFAVDSTRVRFSDVRPGREAPIGNIGYEVLRSFAVTLDSRNRRIRLAR